MILLEAWAMALLGNAMGALACTVWSVGRALPERDAACTLLEETATASAYAPWRSAFTEALAAMRSTIISNSSRAYRSGSAQITPVDFLPTRVSRLSQQRSTCV